MRNLLINRVMWLKLRCGESYYVHMPCNIVSVNDATVGVINKYAPNNFWEHFRHNWFESYKINKRDRRDAWHALIQHQFMSDACRLAAVPKGLGIGAYV